MTGKLETGTIARTPLTFALGSPGDLGRLQADVLPIKTMFMLASGCMPLGGEHFFILAENLLENDFDDGSDSDILDLIKEAKRTRVESKSTAHGHRP